MKQIPCLYSTITDKDDVYHIYVIDNENFGITTFVKSEREGRVLIPIPDKCRVERSIMLQKMMEISK